MLKYFSQLRWLAAAPVAGLLNGLGTYGQSMEATAGPLFDQLNLLHTPGHAQYHYSLRFVWKAQSVVVAADAGMISEIPTSAHLYDTAAHQVP